MSVIFEKSVPGRTGFKLPDCDVPCSGEIPAKYRRKQDAELCELSELDVVRHFSELSRQNVGVDTVFYPLGSCTMKYNPKVNEAVANLEGFVNLHPYLPQLDRGGLLTQGAFQVIYELEKLLCEITGMDAFTLHPMAGAHGELTGMMCIAAYHKRKKNNKTEVLIPDEAHGTNPSSATIAGYQTRSMPTNQDTGMLSVRELEKIISEKTAAIMLTNPNTLGIFNSNMKRIVEIAHRNDALVYYDGANLNAVLGKFRPGDSGVDVMHVNLHKTFSTPHGGGGPGSGPVGVSHKLEPFLPVSRVVKRTDGTYVLNYNYPKSIGYISPFYGNFLVYLRALSYILINGREGLIEVSENAVLNANYVMQNLKSVFELPYDRTCMHEFVLSALRQARKGIRALDIAVKEALMIEPTETESMETLDAFIRAMKEIADKAERSPDEILNAPIHTPVSRPDEVKAARETDLCYCAKR
ncbi:MAG: aminomethyl-transferring glycine dehydrogenase subunit GcvPB [Acidobacteriota bacterium]